MDNLNKEEKQRTKDIELNENVTFDDLMLSEPILSGLKLAGYTKPSPIQLKAIPLGKLGLDLIVQAKSGTGKTLVFTTIALENIITESRALQVLILAPTREISLQISSVIQNVNINRKKLIKSFSFIGGHSINEDKTKLKLCHIAVGTPGRISHLIKEKLLQTDSIRLFILDEADKLLASEFQEDINFIYSNLPENKQMVVLSATYPSYMATYVTRYMRSATFVRLNIVDPSLRGIEQFYKIIPFNELKNINFDSKMNELIKLLSSIQFKQCIVFTNYQLRVENLCHKLTENGWPAIFIAGNIEQNKRSKAIMQLKQFKCRILVSTDLTARGIDAENVDLIICMDVPADAETYLHRIGRAGRYGCHGKAISFVCEIEELKQFESILDTYKLRIKQYNSGIEDIVKHHNNIDGNSIIDDVKIERVNIDNDELVRSLHDYEKAKEQQLKLYNQRKDNGKQKKLASSTEQQNVSCLFNSMQQIEKHLLDFTGTAEFDNLKKYEESIEEIEYYSNKSKDSFENKYDSLLLKYKNKLIAKLNAELEDDVLSDAIAVSESNQSAEHMEEEDDNEDSTISEYGSDDDNENNCNLGENTEESSLHNIYLYNYYYNYYFMYYYKYFLKNSNK